MSLILLVSFLWALPQEEPTTPSSDSLPSTWLFEKYPYRNAKTTVEKFEILNLELTLAKGGSHPFIDLEMAEDAWQFQLEDGTYPLRKRFSQEPILFYFATCSEIGSSNPYVWLERYAETNPDSPTMLIILSKYFRYLCTLAETHDEDAFFIRLATLRKYMSACSNFSPLLKGSSLTPETLGLVNERTRADLAWFKALKPYRENANAMWQDAIDQMLAGVPICDLVLQLPQ